MNIKTTSSVFILTEYASLILPLVFYFIIIIIIIILRIGVIAKAFNPPAKFYSIQEFVPPCNFFMLARS